MQYPHVGIFVKGKCQEFKGPSSIPSNKVNREESLFYACCTQVYMLCKTPFIRNILYE